SALDPSHHALTPANRRVRGSSIFTTASTPKNPIEAALTPQALRVNKIDMGLRPSFGGALVAFPKPVAEVFKDRKLSSNPHPSNHRPWDWV
ncbi:MAG: hypothetical protein WAK55_22130, partial [Xanthobacteraceae bacterium]